MSNGSGAPIKRSRKKKKFNSKTAIIILLVSAVLFAGAAVWVHFSTRYTDKSFKNCAMGDVNGDGYINSFDALSIMRNSVGEEKLFDTQLKNADVNSDGDVNSADVLVLLRYSVGEVKNLPYDDSDEKAPEKKRVGVVSDDDDRRVEVQIANRWKDENGKNAYQLKITVKNKGSDYIDDWELGVDIGCKAKISDKWDCKCHLKDSKLTVSGDGVTSKSTAVCGIILTTADEIELKSLSFETE